MSDLHTDLAGRGYGTILNLFPRYETFKFITRDIAPDGGVNMEVGGARSSRFRVGPDGSSYRFDRRKDVTEKITTARPYPDHLEIFEPFSWNRDLALGLRAPMSPMTMTLVQYYCLLWANADGKHCRFDKLIYPSHDEMITVLNKLCNTSKFRELGATPLNPTITPHRDGRFTNPLTLGGAPHDKEIVAKDSLAELSGEHNLHKKTIVPNAAMIGTLLRDSPVQALHVKSTAEKPQPHSGTKMKKGAGRQMTRLHGGFVVSDEQSIDDTSPKLRADSQLKRSPDIDTSGWESSSASVHDEGPGDKSPLFEPDRREPEWREPSAIDNKTDSRIRRRTEMDQKYVASQSEEASSKGMCAAGPEALPLVRKLLPEVSYLPQYTDMLFGKNSKPTDYQPLRLYLGEFKGKEYIDGKLWAYLKKTKNVVISPRHSIQMEYLEEKSSRDHSSVEVRYTSPGVNIQDFELVQPFSREMNQSNFDALTKYYFLLAKEANHLPEHSIPVNPTFIEELKGSMKFGGYLRNRQTLGRPAFPVERRANEQTQVVEQITQKARQKIMPTAAVASFNSSMPQRLTVADNDGPIAFAKSGGMATKPVVRENTVVTRPQGVPQEESSKIDQVEPRAFNEGKSSHPQREMTARLGSSPEGQKLALVAQVETLSEPSPDVIVSSKGAEIVVQQPSAVLNSSIGLEMTERHGSSEEAARTSNDAAPLTEHTSPHTKRPSFAGQTAVDDLDGRFARVELSLSSIDPRRIGSDIDGEPADEGHRASSNPDGPIKTPNFGSHFKAIPAAEVEMEPIGSGTMSDSPGMGGRKALGKRPRPESQSSFVDESASVTAVPIQDEEKEYQALLWKHKEYTDQLAQSSVSAHEAVAIIQEQSARLSELKIKDDEIRRDLQAVQQAMTEYTALPARKKRRLMDAGEEGVDLPSSIEGSQLHENAEGIGSFVGDLQQANRVENARDAALELHQPGSGMETEDVILESQRHSATGGGSNPARKHVDEPGRKNGQGA